MILPCLIVASALLVSLSQGGMTPTEFTRVIEPMCFKNDEKTGALQVNGQENPLASTLENFISLAEKFEVANPNVPLKEELFFFIRNFTYENIKFTPSGLITKWKPAETEYKDVEILWEPNQDTRERIPEVQDPFTEAEKCSLFFMLSHSVVATPKTVTKQRSYVNASIDGTYRSDFRLEDIYPQELGVVAIMGTDAAVSLSRVLTGLYVGLNEDRKRTLDKFPRTKQGEGEYPQDTNVDPLYILTIAEVLMIAKWSYEEREGLAPNGMWKSIPVGSDRDIKDICPMVYKLQDANSAYTYSSVRGAADGLILGKIIRNLESRQRNLRLSQILRMYYRRAGIIEQPEDATAPIWASFCNRGMLMESLEDSIANQMLLFGFLVTTTFQKLEDSRNVALNYYQSQKSSIYGLWNTVLKEQCDVQPSTDKPENMNKDSPLDVIIVLDTSSGQSNLERQQMVVGYFAKQMNLRHDGSRMTILTDVRTNSPGGRLGLVELHPIVTDTYSSACAACEIAQYMSDGSSAAPRYEVISAINQLLQAKKENETKYSGVKGKVVIYFSFEEEQKPGRRDTAQDRLNRELRDLHLRHLDVIFYALGKSKEAVKKYARNDGAYVMYAVNGTVEETGKNLFKKVSSAPATLQYIDCEEAKSENSAVFEYFVSPSTVQHWSMPASYFYKSRGLKVFFESQYGFIRVCHSRATVSPENELISCNSTTPQNRRIEFRQSNPCQSFTRESCAPFYFGIVGLNSTEEKNQDVCQDTNEVKCQTLDQIKFKVSHEGIRCSGCIGLVATPLFLLLTLITTRIFFY